MYGTGLALGTVWGVVVAALLTGIVISRTALDDRALQGELKGYEEYGTRVRSRLCPASGGRVLSVSLPWSPQEKAELLTSLAFPAAATCRFRLPSRANPGE
jgi:hypothetical protein